MSKKKKGLPDPSQDKDHTTSKEGDSRPEAEGKKPKNFMDQIREINEKEKREEEEAERLEREKQAARDEAYQKAHAERLRKERIEMMKLRQGVMEEPVLTKKVEEPAKNYTFGEKVSNFIYHNSLYFGIIGFALILAGIFVYDMVTAVHPDLTVLYLANTPQLVLGTEKLEEFLGEQVGDRNGDGKVKVTVMYMPIAASEQNAQQAQQVQADMTRLMGELQTDNAFILFADMEVTEALDLSEVYTDLRPEYPGDPRAFEWGYYLKDTQFGEITEMPKSIYDDLFVTVRMVDDNSKKQELAQKRQADLDVLKKMIEAVQ